MKNRRSECAKCGHLTDMYREIKALTKFTKGDGEVCWECYQDLLNEMKEHQEMFDKDETYSSNIQNMEMVELKEDQIKKAVNDMHSWKKGYRKGFIDGFKFSQSEKSK